MKSDNVSYHTGQNGGCYELAYGLCMMMKAIVTIFSPLVILHVFFPRIGLSERETAFDVM